MTIESIKLPPKFDPYILSSSDTEPTRKSLKTTLDKIFSKNKVKNASALSHKSFKKLADSDGVKDHVVTHPKLPGWIIKGTRHDAYATKFCNDVNVYRVRKADKLKKIFKENSCTDCLVPDKLLYQHEKTGEWFVIAQKIALGTKKLQTPSTRSLEAKDRIPLSQTQAKALTLAAYQADLYDVYDHNVALDEKENLVFYDTEPRGRDLKKRYQTTGNRLTQFVWTIIKPLSTQIKGEIASEIMRSRTGMTEEAKIAVKEIQAENHSQFRNKLTLQTALSTITGLGLALAPSLSQAVGSLTSPIFYAAAAGASVIAAERLFELFLLESNHHYVQSGRAAYDFALMF